MEVQTKTGLLSKNEELKKVHFFRGLDDAKLSEIAEICGEHSFATGEMTQTEGVQSNRVHFIMRGRVGTVIHISNITYCNNEFILDTLTNGDAFGWSALIKGTPWSTLKALEPTQVLWVDADNLVKLCEKNNHIGYIVMKNLAALISSRLRRNRMSTLNAIVAIKGEW